jgi:hypothetical protein
VESSGEFCDEDEAVEAAEKAVDLAMSLKPATRRDVKTIMDRLDRIEALLLLNSQSSGQAGTRNALADDGI